MFVFCHTDALGSIRRNFLKLFFSLIVTKHRNPDTHTHTRHHTKREVNGCWKLNWNILQSWCHDSLLFPDPKSCSRRIGEARGDGGTRGERRPSPPFGRRKREETDIRRSVLKTGGHPFAHTLCLILSYAPSTPSLSLPSSFLLHPPSLGKQGQQISLLFSAGPEEEDTWTALRVSAWSSHGPLLPLPLSVGEEAVIVPAPVSEEIGKSDVFVSHLHDNQEKRVGPSRERLRGVRRKSGRSREGVKGFDNGVAVASLWLCQRSMWGCCDLLCVCVCVFWGWGWWWWWWGCRG